MEELLFKNNRPRWIILCIDLLICFFSMILAYLLRFNFARIPQVEQDSFHLVFPYVLATRFLSFYLSKTYMGVVRYTGSKDAARIFLVLTLGSIFLCLTNIFTWMGEKIYIIPFSIIVIEYMSTTFIMLSSRFVFKALYFEIKNPNREKTNVIIFGAGEAGLITKRTLDRDAGMKYKVIAFIDDDPKKINHKLEGITIHPFEMLDPLLKEQEVAQVIISVQQLSPVRKQQIVDICMNYPTRVLHVPPVSNWINGELSFNQIRRIRIEDLLERDPIQLDQENIRSQLHQKTVLVTGAAGSIGSELARQIIGYGPRLIILLDQAESPLYEVEMEVRDKAGKGELEVVIGDIRNTERMENLFRTFKPEVVFHAAAYKHVPMMENNPSESIFTNVLGTKIVADLSVKYGVEKFVMISTDKAVNPSNVMGASKRIAEIYAQALGRTTPTRFITTRFGNVLGSNGSVIPRFRQQIENGGPVTVTHPEITRYFMTIPEACQLVLEAGCMGKGGEIFIFDMGASVKIVDLARKMIKLSGLTLDKDIKIVFTGLRPGEKLYEELLNDKEKTIPTHHTQILKAKVKEYDFEGLSKDISELIHLFSQQNNLAIVAKMKQIVPEYISNNSEFEKLDQPATQ
jgi:FlaA1/EpsC-like NDP-sugar epimerase